MTAIREEEERLKFRQRFKRPPLSFTAAMSLAPIAPTINLDLEIALGAKQQTQEWSSISTTKKLLKDLQVSAKTSEDDKRKKSGSQKKLANNATVYSWLKKRGKTVKKFIDIKTRKDLKEIMAALKVLGIKATKQEIEAMISHVDKDNTVTPSTGELDFEQFIELMTNNPSEGADKEEGGISLATFPLLAKTYHTRKEVSELIFKVIDTDGSGFVAKDELAEALRHFGLHVATEQLTQMIARVDSTGRGEINMADFQSLLSELEQIRDAQILQTY